MEILIIAAIVVAVAVFVLYIVVSRKRPPKETGKKIEVNQKDLEALAAYVKAQKEQAEEEIKLKDLKKAEQRQKLETFKQTKDLLKDKLKSQIDRKEWKPLESVLRSADTGGTGIYILHNKTKNKYYVGQAKQLFKRVRDHFTVEDITLDFLRGDEMRVKFLTANELDADYRLDHIEKTGIEIFDSDKNGYNRTTGNI